MTYSYREIAEYYGLAPCDSGSGYPRVDATMRELTPLLSRTDTGLWGSRSGPAGRVVNSKSCIPRRRIMKMWLLDWEY